MKLLKAQPTTQFNPRKTNVNNLEMKIPDATTLIHTNQYNTDKNNSEKMIGGDVKKIPDTSDLVTTTVLNTNISDVEDKIPNTSSFVTTTVLNTNISDVENKIPNTSSFVTTTVLNIKISEVENKILNNSKHITTQKFSKLTVENFEARLKPAKLVTKTYFDNKITNFNKRITSNKTKQLEVQAKLNSLIRKDYNFFVGRIYFTSYDGSQNTFVYQPTLNTLGFKKTKVMITFLVGNQREYILLYLSNYILLFYIT